MNHKDTETQRKTLNDLSYRTIGRCMEVHRELGPGLLESAYEEALAYELTQAGLAFERQREMPLNYKGVKLDCGYRLDLLVEGKLIVELKAVNELLPLHHAQLLTYLKLEHQPLGSSLISMFPWSKMAFAAWWQENFSKTKSLPGAILVS